MQRQSRVALFGGSFDPVHRAHLEVARRATEAFDLDLVVFTPAAEPPHKLGKELAPGAARLAMLERATADRADWIVSDAELRREGPSYTVDTLEEMAAGGDVELHLILGSDNLPGLPGWKDVERVLTLATPIVVWRDETPDAHLAGLEGALAPALLERVAAGFLRLPPVPMSATEVRRSAARGRLDRDALPDGVAEIILSEGLYSARREEAPA